MARYVVRPRPMVPVSQRGGNFMYPSRALGWTVTAYPLGTGPTTP